jgi:general secretion pathway protein B
MSYIIDALKKLEQEKARKAKRPGSITIAGELFSENRPARYQKSGRNAAIAILAAVALTFAISWYFLKGSGSRVVAMRPSVPATTPQPAISSPAGTAPQPTAAPSATTPAEPPHAVQPPAVPAVTVPAAKTLPGKPVVSNDDEEDTGRRPKRAQSQKAVSAKVAPALAAAPADIQVTGIAWQDERSLRRAVVNGLLLKEGAVISGAQLKEILPDRVRFERSGSLFEVPFVSTGIPAGK